MSIRTSTDGPVAILKFDRLDRKNAITSAMYAALADGLEAAAADAACRVVVITGDPSVFTAGNDLKDFLDNPPAGEDAPVFRFLRAISTFPKPLVAAVCGPAVGVGTTLLLHCDLVYAGDNAQLSLPFVNLGLCPEAASSLLLPRLIGHPRAAEKLMLGDPFTATEALSMGLVNEVLPAGEVELRALAIAARLAAKPSSSLVQTKRLMKQAQAGPVSAQMIEEGAVFGRMLREPAAREAFTAFMQKRAPDFSRL